LQAGDVTVIAIKLSPYSIECREAANPPAMLLCALAQSNNG
jgi:hypothetical protein